MTVFTLLVAARVRKPPGQKPDIEDQCFRPTQAHKFDTWHLGTFPLPLLSPTNPLSLDTRSRCRYIAKIGGLSGGSDADFVTSEMLLCEADDIAAILTKAKYDAEISLYLHVAEPQGLTRVRLDQSRASLPRFRHARLALVALSLC